MKNILNNRVASQRYWQIMVLFIAVLGVLFFIGITFRRLYNVVPSPEELSNSASRAVSLLESIPERRVRQVLPYLNVRHVKFSVQQSPLADSQQLAAFDTTQFEQMIVNAKGRVRITFPLKNNDWLGVVVHQPSPSTWLWMAFWVSIFVLIVAVGFLVRMILLPLALPLAEFSKSVKRFSRDWQAPPLAMQGPTEMQEVIQAFNDMQSQVRRLIQDRTQMLAAISHDLRTPITRLKLRAEYLHDSEHYEKILADLADMEAMISSILSFSRDYCAQEASSRFDLNALLEGICHDFVDAGKAVAFQGVSQLVFHGRMLALKRALTNLIENGIKYGNRVEVSLIKDNDIAQIKVVDEGPGIPEDAMRRVFSPFFRVDTARSLQVQGSGLGLSVARDIIRAHGSDIELINRKPKGLVVLINLSLK